MEILKKEIKKQFNTDYRDKSVFAENARLLQSIWRIEKGFPLNSKRGYGNFLGVEQAYFHEANFLTPTIKTFVKKEIEKNENRKGLDKKLIRKDRLYENLLASQSLAFNLFSELITSDFQLVNRIFRKIFKDREFDIISIDFEISPGRGNNKYTGDKSAFDVFIKFKGGKGKGFIGIGIKYTETLLDLPARYKERYKEVALLSEKFSNEGIERLATMPISLEQIWRDHLLALSMLPPINNDYDEGFFVYLYPKDNTECQIAIDKYLGLLKSENNSDSSFEVITMEKLVNEIKTETNNAQWILDFEDRYLSFNKIEKYLTQISN